MQNYMFSQTFYPNLFLHGYIRHIRDILQLCAQLKIVYRGRWHLSESWRQVVEVFAHAHNPQCNLSWKLLFCIHQIICPWTQLFVFVYLSLYICLYIFVYIYLSFYTFLYIFAFIYLSLYICLFMFVFTYLSLYVCLYIFVFIYLSWSNK